MNLADILSNYTYLYLLVFIRFMGLFFTYPGIQQQGCSCQGPGGAGVFDGTGQCSFNIKHACFASK